MSRYLVKASDRFWLGLKPLRRKYTREQIIEIIGIVKDAIRELADKGYVDEAGWDDHPLVHRPFADGCHFEFHIYDDDVLVIYFKRESKRIIRMVGIYDHDTLPG
ncbi:hypothetical protein [Adlercreutzia sp. ZJ473]|uniref:hypothetical protein n=1 Tax=Adlercreutzia sp. ZJ473 TaxID=2722822 RepID=UPI001553B443|nr:hypothetical protein [Adlercreutzia sp. ZJ473]